MLCFQRLDLFDRDVKQMGKMLGAVDVESCPCSIFFDYNNLVGSEEQEWGSPEDKLVRDAVCLWPTLHGDLRELKTKFTYRGVTVGCLGEDGSKTRGGVRQTVGVRVLDIDAVITTVTSRATAVASFLHEGLAQKVYSSKDRACIERVRTVLDLQSLSAACNCAGASSVCSLTWDDWLSAAENLDYELVASLSEEELRSQFKEFLARLERLKVADLDTKEIMSLFIHPNLGHYKNIEGVVRIMANAGEETG